MTCGAEQQNPERRGSGCGIGRAAHDRGQPGGAGCTTYGSWTDDPGDDEMLPITCTSWYESYAFCIWDGRVPTDRSRVEVRHRGWRRAAHVPVGYPRAGLGQPVPDRVLPGGGFHTRLNPYLLSSNRQAVSYDAETYRGDYAVGVRCARSP